MLSQNNRFFLKKTDQKAEAKVFHFSLIKV